MGTDGFASGDDRKVNQRELANAISIPGIVTPPTVSCACIRVRKQGDERTLASPSAATTLDVA